MNVELIGEYIQPENFGPALVLGEDAIGLLE
jgi:hypothetical protein